MDNSLLANQSFSMLIKLRNHFEKKSLSFLRSQYGYDDKDYLKYKDFVSKIDKIIYNNFFFEISNEDQSHLPLESY